MIKNRTTVSANSSPLEGEPNPRSGFGGGYEPYRIRHARTMRKVMTPWELKLWHHLKRKQLGGFKFRRQQPIGAYIVDFLNAEKRVVVEADGSGHCAKAVDLKRDAYLQQQGYTVLRFWNNEIEANIEGVLTRIFAVLESPPHVSPSARPLPLEGGAKGGQA